MCPAEAEPVKVARAAAMSQVGFAGMRHAGQRATPYLPRSKRHDAVKCYVLGAGLVGTLHALANPRDYGHNVSDHLGTDLEMRYGPFHRRENGSSQTPATAQKQLQSGELWGYPSRNFYQSNLPCVKAFRGPLPHHENGIEFTTTIAPTPNSGGPNEVRWYDGTLGVRLREHDGDQVAVISIDVHFVRP